jgi:DNA-binding LytR/AlgR family response regulator
MGAESWLVHTTMREVVAKLGDEDFVHVHRSTVIRCAFIDRLLHKGRRWTARLNDGCTERIAKSHVASVIAKIRTNPATP